MERGPLSPTHLTTAFESVFPGVYAALERARGEARARGRTWPQQAYLPDEEVIAITGPMARDRDFGRPMDRNEMLSQVIPSISVQAQAYAAWRLGKGRYAYDPSLYERLIQTPISGAIPSDMLLRLPEWCIYIETPGYEYTGEQIAGFFAFISAHERTTSLTLLFDHIEHRGELLRAFQTIPLSDKPIEEAIYGMIRDIYDRAVEAVGEENIPYNTAMYADEGYARYRSQQVAKEVGPLLSLLLYITADNRDIDGMPQHAQEKKVKRGTRFFAADKERLWNVGARIGAAIRKAKEALRSESNATGTGGRLITHVRSAHWHLYYYGPRSKAKEEREKRLLWIDALLVNAEDADFDNLPDVIHPVLP